MSSLSLVSVVLVRPMHDKNVGAVCRAMKCMGLERLSIVGAAPDPARVAITAVGAADLFAGARVVDTLQDALEDATLVAGVSRRSGKKRKYFSSTPQQLADRIAGASFDGNVALVFGNEVSGLDNSELDHCDMLVAIPAHDDFPSLNLSHAVQIVGYEIFKAIHSTSLHTTGYSPLARRELESLVEEITDVLGSIGFFKMVGPQEMGRFLRDIFARAGLSPEESLRLRKIFLKIRGLSRRV